MKMTSLTVGPGRLGGAVEIPPSKSLLHRALICAALAGDLRLIKEPAAPSDDYFATREALTAILKALTAKNTDSEPVEIDCHESGTTLRLLVPVVTCLGIDAVFTGRARLPMRPMQPYADCFKDSGAILRFPEQENLYLPLHISGKPRPGEYVLPGNVSSQFISGLLLALPLLDGPSKIKLSSPLESESYVRMTIDVMKQFGVKVHPCDDGFEVPAPQRYIPSQYEVEPDASQEAFWLLARFLGSEVQLKNRASQELQGDAVFDQLLTRLASAEPGSTQIIDVSQTPDLVPALAAAAAYAPCKTVLANAARLRIKESDRLATTCALLNAFGCAAKELTDGLEIPPGPPKPTQACPEIDGANDHRIVMTAAMLATRHPCRILGAEAVRKSYPDFFDHYRACGGVVQS